VFSIVYSTYRCGGFDILADALSHQTIKEYELIIVDDFKVDRRQAVREYLEERGVFASYIGPSKPKCFPELAFGVLNAMNTGFMLSTCEVVIYLQDYIWCPPDWLEKLEKQRDKLKQNYCIVLPGHSWDNFKPRDNSGLLSVWSPPWKGTPEQNGCCPGPPWIPEGWEFACIAYPWPVLEKSNGWPECLDAYAGHPLEPVTKRLESAGGRPYVDPGNMVHMVNHRIWLPHEMWHQARRTPRGSTDYIERENTFDLKNYQRGRACWMEEAKVAAGHL